MISVAAHDVSRQARTTELERRNCASHTLVVEESNSDSDDSTTCLAAVLTQRAAGGMHGYQSYCVQGQDAELGREFHCITSYLERVVITDEGEEDTSTIDRVSCLIEK